MGLGDDWCLDRIKVTHLPSGRSWAFVLNNWVGKQEFCQICSGIISYEMVS